MRKKIIVFFLILLVVVGIISYWFYQERIFSKEVLKLEILGPENIQMGQEFEYTVRYKNNGNFTLEEPKLIFEYPEYSVTDEGKTMLTKDLKDIYPGEEQIFQFKTRLLGKENDLKIARAWLSFKPKNLKARYESKTIFTTKIDLVPLNLEFDLPSKIESGKEAQFSLNYYSNIDYTFSDLSIITEYPAEFEFLEANPQALEKTEWRIASLKKTEGGRIKIKGKFAGEVGNFLNFKARVGLWQKGEFILLKEINKDVGLINPLLYISQRINGVSDYIASPGEKLHYEIFFRNIGSTPFENQFLLVRLDGAAFDLNTVKTDSGEVQTADNLIIWDWKQVPELRLLDIQEEGKVEFEVQLKDTWASQETNVIIKDKVNISQISQEFQTKVNSKLEVLQKGYFTDPIFGNSGPIPPVAGQPTTYTINWQVKNFYNDVKDVKVRATLSQGVALTGKISPDSEISKFSFDSNSREIVWTVANDLAAGTGVLNTPPNVSFQISLTPNISQEGKTITLINEANINGEDQWTGKIIQGTAPLIDTTLPDDPAVNEQQGIIVE